MLLLKQVRRIRIAKQNLKHKTWETVRDAVASKNLRKLLVILVWTSHHTGIAFIDGEW